WSPSWGRSDSERAGTAWATRCQRVRKSFTTPFAVAVGAAGLAEVTVVPQIAHSVSSEKRYPPHRAQKGELSSRLGWNPGSSANSSRVYIRPQTPHFIASTPIPAPHVRQIRAGASSSATKSSIWSDNPESAEASNSTPQNGHEFAAVPTNDPHSGQRKSSPDASCPDPSERSPRSVSRSADVTP